MYKLAVTSEDEIDFSLIAIYTILDDFKLAFLINKFVPFQLSKSIVPPYIKNKNKINFEYFKFENEVDEIFWYLIPNQKKITIESKNYNFNLFENELENKEYFLTEFKNADYLLKITDNNINLNNFQKKINQIYNISTTSIVDLKKLKTKKHLIF